MDWELPFISSLTSSGIVHGKNCSQTLPCIPVDQIWSHVLLLLITYDTRTYVKCRGPRRKGMNMDEILSLVAASLLALVRGIAISIIIMQAVIAAVLW